MKRSVLLCLALMVVTGCLSDQRWEGRASRCSGNVSDMMVIMLLDGPVGPAPQGQFGTATNSSADNWLLAPISDAQNTGLNLKFEAIFSSGGNTTRWNLDLDRNPSGSSYSGEAEIFVGNSTVRCDVELDLR